MDGLDSEMFQYFKSLMIKGLFEIRKNLDDILVLVEILMKGKIYVCFNIFRLSYAMLRETKDGVVRDQRQNQPKIQHWPGKGERLF